MIPHATKKFSNEKSGLGIRFTNVIVENADSLEKRKQKSKVEVAESSIFFFKYLKSSVFFRFSFVVIMIIRG